MSDFVLIKPEYPKVPDLLLAEIQGFRDSLEYERLNETERRLPGVVGAAFTRFFIRFQDAEIQGSLTERDAKTLDDAYRAIEILSSSREDQVRTLVRDEIFENVRSSESVWRAIERRLGPRSLDLLKQWRKDTS